MPSLVSAVIPAYNSEHWIVTAIDSVLSQTYIDIECIVVDDGSTDRTTELARAYGSRVTVVSKTNGGDASARNAGIEAARGAYIAFLDADDLWLPDKIRRQVEVMESRPSIAMLTGAIHVVDDDLNFIGIVRPAEGAGAFRSTLLLEKPYLSAVGSTAMVRADALREYEFDMRLRASSDWAFACKIAASEVVETIREPLALYRQHEGQIHRRLLDVDHDVRLVFDEAFGREGWAGITVGRRRGLANLHLSLAASHLIDGNRAAAIRAMLRSMWLRPDRMLAGVWRRMRPGGPWDLGGPRRLLFGAGR